MPYEKQMSGKCHRKCPGVSVKCPEINRLLHDLGQKLMSGIFNCPEFVPKLMSGIFNCLEFVLKINVRNFGCPEFVLKINVQDFQLSRFVLKIDVRNFWSSRICPKIKMSGISDCSENQYLKFLIILKIKRLLLL